MIPLETERLWFVRLASPLLKHKAGEVQVAENGAPYPGLWAEALPFLPSPPRLLTSTRSQRGARATQQPSSSFPVPRSLIHRLIQKTFSEHLLYISMGLSLGDTDPGDPDSSPAVMGQLVLWRGGEGRDA